MLLLAPVGSSSSCQPLSLHAACPLLLPHCCTLLPIPPSSFPPSLLPHPSLQAHFLHTYNERASALTAEVEALKGRVREAHRHAKGAEAKIRSLQAGLQEAQEAKQVGRRAPHWRCPAGSVGGGC